VVLDSFTAQAMAATRNSGSLPPSTRGDKHLEQARIRYRVGEHVGQPTIPLGLLGARADARREIARYFDDHPCEFGRS
jgi:hypothetical protein